MRKKLGLLIGFYLGGLLMLHGQYGGGYTMTDTVYTKAERMPFFKGCESYDQDSLAKRRCSDSELAGFISRHLVYPANAMHEGLEGTVFVSFIIDREGWVEQAEILTDIGGGCGEAALDVIRGMPQWEPAREGGETVKVRMNLPIQFFLRAEGRDKAERYRLTWGKLRGTTASRKDLEGNSGESILVRGPSGENCYIDEVEFIYEHENRTVRASSRGQINEELRKVIDRVKREGQFTIRASIQDGGQFIQVSREFQVVR